MQNNLSLKITGDRLALIAIHDTIALDKELIINLLCDNYAFKREKAAELVNSLEVEYAHG